MAYTLVDKPTTSWTGITVPGTGASVALLNHMLWALPFPQGGVVAASRQLIAIGVYATPSANPGSAPFTIVAKPSSSWSVVDKPT